MKKYRRIVTFTYSAVVELEAESKEAFEEIVDYMTNSEICGADMIPVHDLCFDSYGNTEEIKDENA